MTLGAAVSDATPLHYGILIDQVAIFPALFQRLLVPEQVYQELTHPNAPRLVRETIANSNNCLQIVPCPNPEPTHDLHLGEAAVIAVARQHNLGLVLIDDFVGRKTAKASNLKVVGTVGILEVAAAQGLLDFPTAISRLRATNFHISPQIAQAALKRDQARRL